MKKIIFFIFMAISLFLVGCTKEKKLDFTLISKDIPAINYVEDSFVLIEDFDTFKAYFPEYQNIEEFGKMNSDTFSKHTLIYFEYVSHKDFKREEFILNDVYQEDKTLFFEITTPIVGTTAYVTQTLSYLVRVDREKVKDITNYQLIFGVYGEVH